MVKTATTTQLAWRTQTYLRTVLPGLVGHPRPLPDEWQRGLPHYLTDLFDLFVLPVADQDIIVAAATAVRSVVDTQKMILRLLALGPRVLYAIDRVSGPQRQRLMDAGIEFVVPDSQFYAPSLGLILRDKFAPAPAPTAGLSPSAQALLINMILHSGKDFVQASQVARELGYAPITATRAVRELEATGLIQTKKQDRANLIALVHDRQAAWEQAKPLMRNPIVRVEYPRAGAIQDVEHRLTVAGLSALSEATMLGHPHRRDWAISQAEWTSLPPDVMASDDAMDARDAVEIWAYPPTLGTDAQMVDPLSLILTLDDSKDERIELALKELEEKLWR
jgi:DNA-binding MarR family transcriptional regulator